MMANEIPQNAIFSSWMSHKQNNQAAKQSQHNVLKISFKCDWKKFLRRKFLFGELEELLQTWLFFLILLPLTAFLWKSLRHISFYAVINQTKKEKNARKILWNFKYS